MPLSDQLLISGVLLVAAGLACVLLPYAGRFVRSPQRIVPAIPEVGPPTPEARAVPSYVPAPAAPDYETRPVHEVAAFTSPLSPASAASSYDTPLREAPGFGVLIFGIALLVVTGVLGYSVETRRGARRQTA